MIISFYLYARMQSKIPTTRQLLSFLLVSKYSSFFPILKLLLYLDICDSGIQSQSTNLIRDIGFSVSILLKSISQFTKTKLPLVTYLKKAICVLHCLSSNTVFHLFFQGLFLTPVHLLQRRKAEVFPKLSHLIK